MERKGIGLSILLALSLGLSAQFGNSRQVTFRAHATLAPGFLLGQGEGVLNIVGDAEYFVSNHASWRFDGSYYLLPLGTEIVIMNHGVYVGMCFRPTLRNFAPFVGFQPGVHLTQLKTSDPLERPVSFVPVISGIAGFNFYFIDFLHVSAGMRLLHGTTFHSGPEALTEIRGWLGLGFQITTKQRKFDD